MSTFLPAEQTRLALLLDLTDYWTQEYSKCANITHHRSDQDKLPVLIHKIFFLKPFREKFIACFSSLIFVLENYSCKQNIPLTETIRMFKNCCDDDEIVYPHHIEHFCSRNRLKKDIRDGVCFGMYIHIVSAEKYRRLPLYKKQQYQSLSKYHGKIVYFPKSYYSLCNTNTDMTTKKKHPKNWLQIQALMKFTIHHERFHRQSKQSLSSYIEEIMADVTGMQAMCHYIRTHILPNQFLFYDKNQD